MGKENFNKDIYNDDFYTYQKNEGITHGMIILGFFNKYFNFNSIVDFGCGTGNFLGAALEMGIKDIVGIDGDYVDKKYLVFPEENFKNFNLAEDKIDLKKKYDVAICLEVLEHIDAKFEDNAVDNIVRHADTLLISAGHPGQGGTNHINEKPASHWVKKFTDRGYDFIEVRGHFWDNEKIPTWYRANLLFFYKKDKVQIDDKTYNELFKAPVDVITYEEVALKLNALGNYMVNRFPKFYKFYRKLARK